MNMKRASVKRYQTPAAFIRYDKKDDSKIEIKKSLHVKNNVVCRRGSGIFTQGIMVKQAILLRTPLPPPRTPSPPPPHPHPTPNLSTAWTVCVSRAQSAETKPETVLAFDSHPTEL